MSRDLERLERRLQRAKRAADRSQVERQIGRILERNSRAGKIRPVWHQKAERVEAHILVCFLGYVLWKTLSGWQKKAGLGSSPRTILEELKRIESVDVVLPVEGGPEIRLRCVVRPDKAQQALLSRLGLTLPKRLRPHLPAKMSCQLRPLRRRNSAPMFISTRTSVEVGLEAAPRR